MRLNSWTTIGADVIAWPTTLLEILLYGGWTAENTQSSELWSLENARWSLVPPSR